MSRSLIARLAGVLGLAFAGASHSAVFVNEIHYDDGGTDANEAVEIVATAGEDLTQFRVVPYNGNGGAPYTPEVTLTAGTSVSCGVSVQIAVAAIAGLQNGNPDGFALVQGASTVIQFLSYEGSFTAVGGPANGMTSTDIGVEEAGNEVDGLSLRLSGTGNTYA